ncbi:MAG: protein kinase [Bryobacterales bacterium]|nr:protein kinase [Bryobacterales bacterium]
MDTAWTRVEQIFTNALALPAPERPAYVESACAGDAAARAEVLRLLQAQDHVGDFLEASLLDFRGQQFGAYRATDELGRGGMSVVYLGERTSGGFDKRVAIKVILAQSAAAPETQILASLEHPHVARLIDAGTTELGFRYLVMEQVENGVPVTAYAAPLNEERKLRLFLQICAGVQAAHQSLIVHRDLKPDNILVTPAGEAKLLDFGIAKMLAPTGVQTSGLRAYTVDYASPEQILGHPASTANDIYSLGVILYELLAGRLPRVLSELTLEDVVRQVQHDEVSVAPPLTGDLGMITGKALRRDPAERYESAGALARDLERYLAGEAIEARPPSWRYRAGRFVSRHRYPVLAAALAASALAGTAAYALRQAQLAETRFAQVRSLARSVMFELHDAVEPLKGSLPARQLIVNRSLTYLDALAHDPGAGSGVLLDVARGYLRLAAIQGSDYERASLGDSAAAQQRSQQAVAIARRVMAQDRGERREARTVLVEALDALASGQMRAGATKEAAVSAQEQVKLADELLAAAPNDPEARSTAAASWLRLGDARAQLEEWKAALPALARAEELYRAAVQAAPNDLIARNHWARSLNFLATNSLRSGDKAAGEKYARAALDVSRSLHEADPKRHRALYASDLGTLAYLESAAGRYQAAIDLYSGQLQLRQAMLADNPKDAVTGLRVGATLGRLSLQLRKAGRFPEAIRRGEEALRQIRPLQAADPTNTYARTELLFGLTDLADAYVAGGARPQACALLPEVNALLADLTRSPFDPTAMQRRARNLAAACGAALPGPGRN